jgi:hypothetical protein
MYHPTQQYGAPGQHQYGPSGVIAPTSNPSNISHNTAQGPPSMQYGQQIAYAAPQYPGRGMFRQTAPGSSAPMPTGWSAHGFEGASMYVHQNGPWQGVPPQASPGYHTSVQHQAGYSQAQETCGSVQDDARFGRQSFESQEMQVADGESCSLSLSEGIVFGCGKYFSPAIPSVAS